MKAKYLAILAGCFGIVACNIKEESNDVPLGVVSFHAVSGDVPGTKTVLQSDGSLLWSANDKIDIFVGVQSFEFTGTNTSAVSEATFTGSLDGVDWSNGKEYWAVYPHSDNNASDGSSITVSLPAEQDACVGSFANNLFISIAKSQDYDLTFFNVCGGIKFSVTESGVESVTFKGKNGEAIAGTAKIAFDQNGKPTVQEITNPLSEVTLSAPAGTTFEVGKWYYIVCFPTVLENGYVMSVKKADGTVAKKIGDSSVSIKRAIWGRIKELDKNLSYSDPYLNEPFTITSSGSTLVTLRKQGSPSIITLEYRIGSNEWASYTIGSGIDLVDGESLQFRAGEGGNATFTKFSGCYRIYVSGSGTVDASGNIMSLLDRSLLRNDMPEYGFEKLFYFCDKLVNAVNLRLPAATLAQYCYNDLFYGCTSLISAPQLPATTLADGCYQGMFNGCIGLTYAPELSATTLAKYCYSNMFRDCAVLSSAPDLPASTLARSCYSSMFQNCTELTSAPDLPATILDGSCYAGMFNGCTGLTSAPDLPATTLADCCYIAMFHGCTNLSTAPELPATTLTESCYENLFSGCSKLNHIIMLATNISASYCLNNWVDGVSATGTFVKNSRATWNVTGPNGIPSGWTVLTTVPTPEAVDLGLSVKWAPYNVGADSPKAYGGYYAWGEIEEKEDYSWGTYKWANGWKSTLTKYNTKSGNGTVDNITRLSSADDVAHVAYHGKWRMPTTTEWTELKNQCSWVYDSSKNGYNVTGPSGKTIFIPLSGSAESTNVSYVGEKGYYWTANLASDSPNYAFSASVSQSSQSVGGYTERIYGYCVRAVYDENCTYDLVQSISLNITDLQLTLGRKCTLAVLFTPEDATNQNVSWISSNPEVASVSKGTIASLSIGTATITATSADGNHVATCQVEVIPQETNDYVDLGLSVKWGTRNIGAATSSEYGDYYAWGETTPKDTYSWDNYLWCNGSSSTLTKYNNDSSYGIVDNKLILEETDDVATVKLGSKWRMPNSSELSELFTKCAFRIIHRDGVLGALLTRNDSSIFIPYAGFKNTEVRQLGERGMLWSRELAYPEFAKGYNLFTYTPSYGTFTRNSGVTIRPVCD